MVSSDMQMQPLQINSKFTKLNLRDMSKYGAFPGPHFPVF